MVKLYLHCGYHKTGSSFLQVMFAQNRDYLLKNKIYFPSSKEDKKMISGKISPGNGFELVKAIRNKNRLLVNKLLKNWVDKSITNNANILFISSEGLFHVLAELDLMNLFIEVCNELGITDITALLFFRDPVSHVFSVFKHRGKNGEISDYRDWVKNEYETLNLTKNFLGFYKDFNIKWMFRKYSSESESMVKIAFDDFLEIKSPDIPKTERVNISLTLSEIIMMREVKDILPNVYLRKMHIQLSNLPLLQKGNNDALKEYYSKITYQELKKYDNIIEEANKLLAIDEQLQFKQPKIKSDVDVETISLTPHQIKIFTRCIDSSNSFHEKIINKTKYFIKRIKRKIKEISHETE